MRGDYAEKWKEYETNIRYLVRASAHYLVYVDNEIDVDYVTSEEWDADGPKDNQKYNSILNRAALLESTPCTELDEEIQITFKRLIGDAIARSLDHDYASADGMLAAASDYIKDRSAEKSRAWYLAAGFFATVPFATAGCLCWLFRRPIISSIHSTAFWLFMTACSGSVGALFSIITRSGKLNLNASAGRTLHYVEGASRIIAGIVSGTVVGLGVQTGIILSSLAQNGTRHAIMVLGALAGGAGERLASSIIATIDTHDGKQSVGDKPGSHERQN